MVGTDPTRLAAGVAGRRAQDALRAANEKRSETPAPLADGGRPHEAATIRDTAAVGYSASSSLHGPITDADDAAEQVRMARSEILQLVDMAVLKQSLEQQQQVLSLFESA